MAMISLNSQFKKHSDGAMSDSEDYEGLYDILFELSNDIRHKILLLLREKPERMTQVAKILQLTSPEVSRHLTRLTVALLIRKDMDNLYYVTGFGEYILNLLDDLVFMVRHRDYFVSHNAMNLPSTFQKHIPELSSYSLVDNFMVFLNFLNEKIMESTEYVWLYIDQYPLTAINSMLNAVERGVKFRIIGHSDITGPNVAFEEKHLTGSGNDSPNVEIRNIEKNDVYLFISDAGNAIAFPTRDGFDYSGFTNEDIEKDTLSKDIFNHYWSQAKPKTAVQSLDYPEAPTEKGKTILVNAQPDPAQNVRAIQNAVDNYDEVVLKGIFNLGSHSIVIQKSVVIRGHGRHNEIPLTKVFNRGWDFPSRERSATFGVGQEGVDVTIENIHFQDFNGYCIVNSVGNSSIIRNNRITLDTGLGRGQTYGQEGDVLVGIMVGGGSRESGSFPGGVIIEGNYIDFATSYVQGGIVSKKILDDPDYRPDLKNHENYIGYGIQLNRNLGKINVKNNVVRNINARGIIAMDNHESAEIHIEGNTVISEVYGAYPYNSHISGVGIWAQSAWSTPRTGSRVTIENNKIICDKVNYCGIGVSGPAMYREGAGKLDECIVRNNEIHLSDGSVGVLIRKADNTEISDNRISGKAYYGFHFWGSRDREGINLESNDNLIEDNDMSRLVIKPPDEYSNNHVDGRMFTGTEGKSATAHIWINKHSNNNEINVNTEESVIDEGKNNIISTTD